MSLRHYTVRAMEQRPGRTILTMLSIVIGVAAAVAVGLGTATTRTVVISVFLIIVVDAVFATITTVMTHGVGG